MSLWYCPKCGPMEYYNSYMFQGECIQGHPLEEIPAAELEAIEKDLHPLTVQTTIEIQKKHVLFPS